jgi:hypothetical protein
LPATVTLPPVPPAYLVVPTEDAEDPPAAPVVVVAFAPALAKIPVVVEGVADPNQVSVAAVTGNSIPPAPTRKEIPVEPGTHDDVLIVLDAA